MITCLRAFAIVGLTGVLGCQDYLFEQKFAEKVKETTIMRAAAEPTPADILFVVDNSGSMADEQMNLATNFQAFIEQIQGSGDYQIAVVTTDLLSRDGEMQGLVVSNFAQTGLRSLIDIQTSGCTPTGIPHGCFRGPDAAKRIISSERMQDPMDQITAFQQNVLVGSCGTGEEKGLEAMLAALENTRGSGCNAGFLREGANLVVIIVSDEQDAGDGQIDQYIEDLLNYKSYAQIRVAMVVGAVDGEASHCQIPATSQCGGTCDQLPPQGSQQACTSMGPNTCPNGEVCIASQCDHPDRRYVSFCHWCSYYDTEDCCSALNGSRYVEFARKAEARISAAVSAIPVQQCRGTMENTQIGCLVDSICQENFSATLERIAKELVITSSYPLNPPAVYPEGVRVILKNGRFPPEGKELKQPDDFEVIDEGRTLNLKGENVPVRGEDIEIYFVTEIEKEAQPQ